MSSHKVTVAKAADGFGFSITGGHPAPVNPRGSKYPSLADFCFRVSQLVISKIKPGSTADAAGLVVGQQVRYIGLECR